MANQWSFVFMLSLKEISLRRVVINLWNERDILSLIEKYYSNLNSDTWSKFVELKVINKLSNILIPKSLKTQALLIVTPIGLEIKRWKEFHERYLRADWVEFHKKDSLNTRIELDAPILLKLCWTTCGRVDYRKTAEELVRCEMLGMLSSYKLACLYCLEDSIPLLWEKLPEEISKMFYYEKCSSQLRRLNLQFCWPYFIKGEQSRLDSMIKRLCGRNISFNLAAFETFANNGNKAATEYFFQKLTREEKDISLNRTAIFLALDLSSDSYPPTNSLDTFPLENTSDVLFYLISLMNHEERIKNFQLSELLIFFLDWRWHDLFLKFADLNWTSLPARSYGSLLINLSDYFRKQKYYFPFLSLFQEFFSCSPINFRKEFVDRECQLGLFFPQLFDIQDSETIRVIFRNVDAADRVRLVSCERIFQLFFDFILKEKDDIVKLCLREATLSYEDRESLTDAFLAFRNADRQNITYEAIRCRFLKLMDEIYGYAQGMRSSEDDALNEAKKLRASDKENC